MSFYPAPWPLPAGVCAGWTTRTSGVSGEPYTSFNLALHVGDNDEHVLMNRQRLVEQLPGRPQIHWLNQTHSTVVVEAQSADKQVGQDASYTRRHHQACCVMTADCLPVFFWDHQGQQVAVAHAGWRGLADGILAETLKNFSDLSSVSAGIGPAISKRFFEVGEDVVAAFSHWSDSASFFKPKEELGKFYCDLPGLAEAQLKMLGLNTVYQSQLCSYERKEQFYSYRRDGQTGRMANLIWMTDSET